MLGAKYGGANAACSIVVYSLEALFPTILQSTVYGISNIIARVLTIGAPLVAEMKDPVPLIVFTVNVTVAIAVSFLIVTKLPKFI